MNDDHDRQFLSMERLWRAYCDLKADRDDEHDIAQELAREVIALAESLSESLSVVDAIASFAKHPSYECAVGNGCVCGLTEAFARSRAWRAAAVVAIGRQENEK